MDGDDQQQLGRIEAKLDAALEKLTDHEVRIRTLERLRWLLHGVWVVVSAVIAFVVSKF